MPKTTKPKQQTEQTELAYTACECHLWEIGDEFENDGEPDMDIITTGCEGTLTRSVFAPGHDAKLKSLLIRAGVQDLSVRYGRPTGTLVHTDWRKAAAAFGFADQVHRGVELGREKAAEKAQRDSNDPTVTPLGTKIEGLTKPQTSAAGLTKHRQSLVNHVRDYAAKHTSVAGWNMVNDPKGGLSDGELAEIIGGVRGEKAQTSAVRRVRAYLDKITRGETR